MKTFPGLKIENANYEKVTYYIDKMLAESDSFCRCVRCRVDAAALALNTLPPHYYVIPSHANENDLGSPWILIEMAAREALARIRQYPNHKHHHGADIDEPSAGIPIQTDNTVTE